MGFGAGSVGSSGAPPVGSILMFGGDDAPDGYRLCDGTAISRTTFANLFAEIGTNYGIGDGSTTFNLPDFRTSESYPSGAVNNAALGDTGGSRTITVSNMPSHDHLNRPSPLTFAGSADGAGGSSSVQLATTTNQTNRPANLNTDTRGGGADYDPPFVAVNFIIKS